MWIVQELSLAKQGDAIVRCGKHKSIWWDFLIAAYAIDGFLDMVGGIIWERYPDETVECHQHGVRLAQCRKIDAILPDFALLELLNQHRDCAATDPRDKVYGLLGLAGDVATTGLNPSYTSSPVDVFTDLFQKHAAAPEILDMLCEVRFPKDVVDLPSWVPGRSSDQTVPGICIHNRHIGGNHFTGSPIEHYEEYRAAGDARAGIQFKSNAVSIVAFHVGTIAYLGQVDPGMTAEDLEVMQTLGMPDPAGYSGSTSNTFNDWCNIMLKCPDWDKIEARYGADDALEVFCRTWIGDRNIHMTIPRASNDSDEDHAEYEEMTDIEECSDEEQEEQENTRSHTGEDRDSLPSTVEDNRLFFPWRC
jgi:hypothetical protein